MATVLEQSEISKLLVNTGADIFIKGPKGRTAVNVARLSFADSWVSEVIEGVSEVENFTLQQDVSPEKDIAHVHGAGEVFRDCDFCPELVVVPAGSFSRIVEKEKRTFENDHLVIQSDIQKLNNDVKIRVLFAVGKYEITVKKYASFVEQGGHASMGGCIHDTQIWRVEDDIYSWQNPGFSQAENDPVACLNWHDYQSYVRWLSRETGENYRLLSESEWEYLAQRRQDGAVDSLPSNAFIHVVRGKSGSGWGTAGTIVIMALLWTIVPELEETAIYACCVAVVLRVLWVACPVSPRVARVLSS
ncbi:MAG: SUMF1/EgtB/PvdO family nonheme iron enzyme [Gammaproteobacteria bacterium]|nr:SUMF1/EgtB/PvdO family nonheme iron enzyme [Gammaproteobacteria bacterium]